MKASLCPEAAEMLQWLYSSGRPRSCDRMPSLVGDRGLVLQVLGWALTRMCNILLHFLCEIITGDVLLRTRYWFDTNVVDPSSERKT